MGTRKTLSIVTLVTAASLPLILAEPAFAQAAGVTQVENFLKSITGVLTGIVGTVAVIFLVLAGYMYMTSAGNPERLDKAKSTLKWTIIGIAIVLGALVLANMIGAISKQSFGG